MWQVKDGIDMIAVRVYQDKTGTKQLHCSYQKHVICKSSIASVNKSAAHAKSA